MQPLESISQLALPPQVDCRLQDLVRRQAEAPLSVCEQHELDVLNEAKDTLARLRDKAHALPSIPAALLGQDVRNGLPIVLVPAGTRPIDPELVRRFLQEDAA